MKIREAVADAIESWAENLQAANALRECGWFGASDEGLAGDIQALATAWSDAEVRAANAEAAIRGAGWCEVCGHPAAADLTAPAVTTRRT